MTTYFGASVKEHYRLIVRVAGSGVPQKTAMGFTFQLQVFLCAASTCSWLTPLKPSCTSMNSGYNNLLRSKPGSWALRVDQPERNCERRFEKREVPFDIDAALAESRLGAAVTSAAGSPSRFTRFNHWEAQVTSSTCAV